MEFQTASLRRGSVHRTDTVEQEQIQKRTFTNWINAQLSKRTPASMVQDLFTDLQDGTRLLDLLEVMSGQRMKRERGRGVFQHRGNIETALTFLKSKKVKLVNINVPDIIEGRPSIVLGLIWTIILHCHIEELASTLSFSSRQSSLESLASLDSQPSSARSSPVPGGSPVPRGHSSPLHNRFRLSAKKALLLWVRDQCRKVGYNISVKDFKSSWRSGLAFLAILCSLRPDLVDLSRAQHQTSLHNLEEAFRLAEQELHIPRLLEPEDIDVSDPDEKSIMTYVAQFLQYSNDMPSPDEDIQLPTAPSPTCLSPVNLPSYFTPAVTASPLHQASPNQKAREMATWLQRSYQELEEVWSSSEGAGYAERYQSFQAFLSSFHEQRRPVIPVLSAVKRSPKPSAEQLALRLAWSTMEHKLQQYSAELDLCLPTPLDALGRWLQRVEAVLAEEGGVAKDHAHAAREAREKQEELKVLVQDMGQHLNTLHVFSNTSPNEATWVPPEKLEELKRRFTNARVTAKYHGIKLEYREQRHTVYDLLGQLNGRLKEWRGPYASQESVRSLLQDWHEVVDKQCLVSMLKAALHKLKQTASTYSSKAALVDDAQMVSRQVKEVEAETSTSAEGVTAARVSMGRVLAAWESYRDCLFAMQVWLGQQTQETDSTGKEDSLREWIGRHAQLNEVGNFLIESTEGSTSFALADELCKVNKQWADFVKRTRFAVAPTASSAPACTQAAQALLEEAGWLAREAVEVSSGALRNYRKRLQVMIKKITEVDLDVLATSPDCSADTLDNLKQALPKLRECLGQVQQACEGVQRGASLLEGRLAELGHWGTEVSEALDTLREWERRGHPGLRSRVKTLVSRGLQLEEQLRAEEQELGAVLASVKTRSTRPYLSISTLQDRVQEALAHSKESLGMLSRLDVKREGRVTKGQPPPKVIIRAQSQPDLHDETHTDPSSKAHLLQAHSLPQIPEEVAQEAALGQVGMGSLELQASTTPSRVASQPTVSGLGHMGSDQVCADDRSRMLSQGSVVLRVSQSAPSSPAGGRMSLHQEDPAAQPHSAPQTPSPRTRVRTRQRQRGSGSGSGSGKAEGAPKPPVQSEVYLKARSLARSRLEGAKLRLQEHIQEAIAVFSDRTLSEEQAQRKEHLLQTLKPTLLEDFLGSVEGMSPFCSEAQLREMEVLAQSVRGQWEACVSASEPEGQIRALQRLEDTLGPPQPVVWTTTRVKETEGRLEVAQKLNSRGTETAPPSDKGEVTVGDGPPQREAFQPVDLMPKQAPLQGPHRSMETLQVLQRRADSPNSATKQEEGSSSEEVYMRYRTAHSAFDLQLQRNSQQLSCEVPQSSSTLQTLHTLLQELQALRQETEALWFEFELQFSQCGPELEGVDESTLRQERAQLIQQWRAQQICLQARVKTLQTAVTLMEPADIQRAFITNRLDHITKNPLNITEFTLTDSGTLHEDLKLLDDNIQTELDRLAGFERCDNIPVDPSAEPDLQHIRSAIQQAVQSCRNLLDQQRKRLRRTDSAVAELERFLDPLQQAGSDLSHLTPLPSASSAMFEDSSRLIPIQRRAKEAAEEAPRIDALLGDAELRITLDGAPASCEEVAGALGRHLEEAQARIRGGPREEQRNGQKEPEQRHRRRQLMAALKELKGGAERQGLKEPTLPALQQRLRTFTDMESKLAVLHTDLQTLQQASAQTTDQDPELRELERQWEQTHQAVKDRREQCQSVMEMLKKFQGCRSRLSLVLQQAEQTIGDQASYMGKDNLQRLLSRVMHTKEELSGLGDGVEEIRGVCRQLQHQLRGIPECADAPFENEADAIMDRWLDVMERTDCYLDNLRVGLSLWDKLLALGGEVEAWTTKKLADFVQQSQPFQGEQEVISMQEEIKSQEESVEHFHRRSCEIQSLLQSQEPPLELQVIESQLRKRMDQVKELFCESSGLFKELLAARGHVSAKMAASQSALQSIHDTLRSLETTEGPALLETLEEISGELDAQARQVASLQQELGLMSGVSSPQTLQALAADGNRLQESVCAARALLQQRREQAEDMHRLYEEHRELKGWLNATQSWVKSQDQLSGLRVEMDRQSARVEAFRALVATVQAKTSVDNSSLLEDCWKLLDCFEHLQAQAQTQSSPQPQELALRGRRDVQALVTETQGWIRDMQQQVEALGTSTQGSEAQIEKRLQQAKAVLAQRQEGDSRLEELRALAQAQAQQQEGVDESQGRAVQSLIQGTEAQWVTLQQDAEQLNSFLQGVMERVSSCRHHWQQARLTLEELQAQATALPRLFPWPGTAQRQEVAESARALLERAKGLGPALSALRAQRTELVSLMQDPSWTEPSWALLEDGGPDLIRELNELCTMLTSNIQKEQRCLELLQQCREGLASQHQRVEESRLQAMNSQSFKPDRKALTQARRRIDRDLQEATALSCFLTESLSPDGQASLTAELQALQDLRAALEKTTQDMLANRQEQQQQTGDDHQSGQRLMEETTGLQGELQSLNAALETELKAGEDHDHVSQLHEHWVNLKTLEEQQQALEVHLQELQDSVGSSEEVASALTALNKQSLSLGVSVSESLRVCKERTALSMRQSIQVLRLWSHSQSQQCSDTAQSTEMALQEGEVLRQSLQGALSQEEFLKCSMGQELMQSLAREGNDALTDSAAQLSCLSRSLELAKTTSGDRSIEPDNTLRSSSVKKTTLEQHGQLGATSCQPKPTFPIVLDTELSEPSPITASTDVPVSESRWCVPVHPDASTPQASEGMDVSERNLKPRQALTKPLLELTGREQPEVDQVDDGPPPKKVATIILDVEPFQNNSSSTEGAVGQPSQFKQSGCPSSHGGFSNDKLKTTEHDLEQEAQQDDKVDQNQSLLGTQPKSNSKKVFTLILESSVSTNESTVSQTSELVEKGADIETCLSKNSLRDLQKHLHTSALSEDVCTSAADRVGDGLAEVRWCEVNNVKLFKLSEAAHSSDVKLDLSQQKPLDGTHPGDSLTSQELPLRTDHMAPALNIAPMAQESGDTESVHSIHIETTDGCLQKAKAPGQSKSTDNGLTVTANKHERKNDDIVTSESSNGKQTGTRDGKPTVLDEGVSVNVASASVSCKPDAVSTSPMKDEADLQKRHTYQMQMNTQHKEERGEIPSQCPKEIFTMASKTDKQSLQDKDTDLPDIIPEEKMRATKERGAPSMTDLSAGDGAGGQTGTSPQGPEPWATLMDILADAEAPVKAPLGGKPVEVISCLQPTMAEPETQLGRMVHKVLDCRYQPAQLNPQVMAQQLQEAETCRQCVQQQVALSCQYMDKDQHSEATKRMEGCWSAALLDASATVQVKEAQLLQITEYHQQTEALRASLQRFTAEMEMLSLDNLESSSLQAEKLQAFLTCMDQEKGRIGDLVHTCCQISTHLSEADGPVALLAQVEGLQEGWQILQGTAHRTMRHATACTAEASAVLQEAKELHIKLENIQASIASLQSSTPISNCQLAIQLTITASELTTANEQYFNLLGLLEAFNDSFLGKKERDEMEESLQASKGQLHNAQEKMCSIAPSVGDPSVGKLIEMIQEFLPWAKHVEQQIEARRKVALFPEHAHHQLTSMKRLQSEVSARQTKVTSVVEEQKALLSGQEEGDVSVMLSLLEDLEDTYHVVSEKVTQAIEDVDRSLRSREEMWTQIADVSKWLVDHIEKESSRTRDSKLKISLADLKVGLQKRSATLKETDSQAAVIEALVEQSAAIIPELSIGESHYLIDRLAILQAEVSGVASCERAACWELDELLHAQQAMAEELAAIQKSLKQISMDFERQRFPVTTDSLSTIEPLRHMLVEHQCQVQELQHCQEPQRKGLLQTISTLQAKARMLDIQAREHEKYLSRKKCMEDSREAMKRRIPLTSDQMVDWRERLRMCRALLVELPLVRQQCQQAADQLEAIAGDVYPSQLASERQKIHRTVENLATWEITIHNELCILEHKLLEGLSHPVDLTALTNVFHKVRHELQRAAYLHPDEQAVVGELQRCSRLQRSLESGLRVLEALERHGGAEPEAVRELSHYGKKIFKDCKVRMENLSQALEALKDYQWAVQGAVRFLDDAEPRLLLDLSGTRDCQEELQATQQTVAALRDSFKAHVDRLGNLVPKQTCFSTVETQRLHIQVLSLLLVREAMLEAQGQLRMETLKRFIEEQSIHKSEHMQLSELFQRFECRLNDCLTQKATSFEQCLEQHEKAKALQEELWCLAGRLEQLRGTCPALGCGVPSELGLALLWRKWARMKHRAWVLRASSVQRDQEWKDAILSMERCNLALEGLSRELPDPTSVRGSPEELQAVLALTEHQQEWLDHEQQALASLLALVARLLGPPAQRDPDNPAQVSQELQLIQTRCKSLREQCMLVRRMALTEMQERGREMEEVGAIRQRVASLCTLLQVHGDTHHTQEAKIELDTQRAKLQLVIEGVKKRYLEVPPEIQALLEEVTHSLEEVEEKLAACTTQQMSPHDRLSEQVREVTAGLVDVQVLLQQSSSSVTEAEGTLKRVWDELDRWHSQLAVLEAEVQEVAMEEPDKVGTLMDELTDPLQLYQIVAKQAEQRTAFLSRIPACLQEYEDLLNSATHWQEESKSWLNTTGTYTSAKCLHSHALSLQMVLDDAERITLALEAFVPVMQEIAPVCATDSMQERLKKAIHNITHMQQSIMEPHAQFQHLAEEVDAIEAEVKAMEKNVNKINTILTSMDTENAFGQEHLQYCQVILENIRSMRRTLTEIEHCRLDLGLPRGAEDTLTVFQRARNLQQPMKELEHRTQEQSSRLEESLRLSMGPNYHQFTHKTAATSSYSALISLSSEDSSPRGHLLVSKETALVTLVPEDITREVRSLSPTAPLTSAKTSENSKGEKTRDPGSNVGAMELIVKAKGESSAGPGSDQKELTSPKPEPVSKDRKSEPKDVQSVPVLPGPVAPEPESLVMELPYVVSDAEAVTKEPLSATSTEVVLVTQQSDSFHASPASLSPCKEVTTENEVTEPHMISPVLGGELQDVPTAPEYVSVPTALHSKTSPHSSEAAESIMELPESVPAWLTHPQKTDKSSLGVQHGLMKPADLREEAVDADVVNGQTMSPIEEKHSARAQTAKLPVSVPAQPEEGATAKGDLARLLTSLSGKQEMESPVFLLQDAVAKQTDPSTVTADHTSSQGTHGRELRSLIGQGNSTGSEMELQGCAEALLKGLSALLQLGNQRLQRSQDTKPCSRSQLQPLLSRHKKFFQGVGHHWALLQFVSQQLAPEVVQSLPKLEEQVAKLQRRAVDQGSRMQRNLQEWSQLEEVSGRLARLLDELEAGMPSGGPHQEPEGHLRERATAHQRLWQLLEESKPELGLVQDQCRALRERGCSPLGVSTTAPGSGLELRWASVHRRLHMEQMHSEQIRKQWDRFEQDSQALEEWLAKAKDQLQVLAGHPESEPEDAHWIQLTPLMGFCQQAEARHAQWASACDAGSQLLQLMDSEAPGLRGRLAQLEKSWTDVMSALPALQSRMKEILSALPPCELLSSLSVWLRAMEESLEEVEEEKSHQATDAAGHAGQLKCWQARKAELVGQQACMERLCQLVEEAGHVKDQAEREERTQLAEQVGALHLHWLSVQAKADHQIRQVEDQLHVCSQREGRLHRLRSWVSAQRERLSGYETPDSCFHTDKALQSLKDMEEKAIMKYTDLLELKAIRLFEDEEHPSDQLFSAQVDLVMQDYTLLTQQMNTLRPLLQQVWDQWVGFERELAEATLVAARTQHSLDQRRTPCLSLQQSSDLVDQMQALQHQAEEGAGIWSSVGGTLLSLCTRVSPGAARLLTERVEMEKARWMSAVQAARAEHQQSQELLELWREYGRLTGVCARQLSELWEQAPGLAAGALQDGVEDPTGHIQASLEAITEMELGMEGLQTAVGDVLEAAKLLIGLIEPQGAALIQSETRLLSRDIVHLGQALIMRREQLQEDLEQYQNFSSSLESLELHLRGFESGLLRPNSSLDDLKRGLLELSGQVPDLGALNELSGGLRLTETAQDRLRTLNKQWLQVFTQASERYREMYAMQLPNKSFKQRCEDWFGLLEKMEADLASDVCAIQPALREQHTQDQKLKIEMFAGQQLLQSVVKEALQLLETGSSEDSNLVVKLTGRQERWQEALRLAQSRGTLLQRLMGQWRLLSSGQRRLWRLLSDLEPLLPPAGLAACSLHQLHSVIQDFECAQRGLQEHRALYAQVLEAGGELVSRLDGQNHPQTQSHMREDLDVLRKSWEDTQRLLGVRKALAESVILTWKHCEAGLADSAQKLEEIKARLEQPLPENLEELHKEENLSKEHQEALEEWGGRLRELATMKADASQYVLAADTTLLQGQLDQLNGHWEELCLKVSLRKQEIADRLNAWVIFNDKNKELCEWLGQMQNKVAHSGEDLSIEEMVEKLKKDCMEEINLFSENKSHLKQLGEQLLSASDKTKEAEIHGALRDVNTRWQSLFDHIEARVKKLKETLVTVQQLDKNMNNLRTWLSHMESQLAQPVLYAACRSEEIQSRLAEHQELQRDIEQHKESVASVLTLCDTLLRDEDACESGGSGSGSGAEGDSIQQTTRSLDQRWRNICTLSLEKRLRIEETWRLWCKFKDDYSRLEDWLKEAERIAANPNSSDVLHTDAKEELKNFEGFQREVHDRLTQLEVINHQYRQLARENRTDSASHLKAMVRLSNQRWDALQRRTAAILRRLRYFTAQREEFESRREGLLVWLTELDLQLTNVEHFSESDIHEKLKRLNGFQKEITLNTNRIDALIVFGEALIQRSCPTDAAHIEDELVELHTYCQEVFRRAARFHQRLTSPQPELKEEPELQQASPGLLARQSSSSAGEAPASASASAHHPSVPVCLVAPLLERSGRETPVSVDSIPLEWDHTGDVGGSSSHEEDDEGTFYSTLSDVSVTESAEVFMKGTAQLLGETLGPGQSLAEAQSWHSQDSQLDVTDSSSHTPTQTSTPYKQGYVRLMSECSGSIKSVKRVSLILDDEEQQEEPGLTGLTTADKQSGVIERWELLQAQAMSKELRSHRDAKQLTSDLSDITAWLGQVTPELVQQLQRPEPNATIEAMEAKVRQLKDMQKTFASYKAKMLSLNLGGQELQQQQQQQGEGEGEEESPEGLRDMGRLQEALQCMNQSWTDACTHLEDWESSLRSTLMRCQEFHETLHSLLLWLAHAESRRFAVNIHDESTPLAFLCEHKATLKSLEAELLARQGQVGVLQELTAQLLPEAGGEDSIEAREKLHVISNKLRLLLRQVGQDLSTLQKRLDSAESPAQSRQLARVPGSKEPPSEAGSRRSSADSRVEKRDPSPQRSFFQRVLRAAFPLHLLFLLLLVLACLVPLSEDDYSCTLANNFARSFYPMLRYTNGPPPT